MYTLSLFALVIAVFVLLFAAFNVRKAGWSSLVIGVMGALLILVVAAYGADLVTFGDHLLHMQQPITTAHAAALSAGQVTQKPHTTHTRSIPATTKHMIIAPVKQQVLSKRQTAHQSAQPTTRQVTIQNTLLPLLQALSFGLILGILVLVLAAIAITHKRRKVLAEAHASSSPSSPSSAICRECRQAGRKLKQYAWRSSEGERTGLLCDTCAHRTEAIHIVWQ